MFEETHTLQLSWVHTVRFIIGLQILIHISNTYITDNSSPARILSFKK